MAEMRREASLASHENEIRPEERRTSYNVVPILVYEHELVDGTVHGEYDHLEDVEPYLRREYTRQVA
jgi:hypothetical protein